MRTFDLTPLYRATVGFDRVAEMMDRVLATEPRDSYPPYNIEKTGEDAWRITIAVAGFTDKELSVEVKDRALVVSGKKTEDDTEGRTFLHRGIATRAFQRRFHLADHVQVTGATHADGLLHIDLVREVPEELKPRQIEIQRAPAPDMVEGEAKTVN